MGANRLADMLMLQRKGEGSYLRQQFPKVYGALGGLMGTAPDEMQGSVMDPNTAAVRQGAAMGYIPGMIAGSLPPVKGAAGLGALAGMFVGKGSKTWDALQAAKAVQLEKAGVDARKIWSETGNWRGPDGMWRQEIPDNKAYIKGQQGTVSDAVGKFGNKLSQVMEHSRLEKAYPELNAMPIEVGGSSHGAYGTDLYGDPGIRIGANVKGASTPLHEVQHAIQDIEGFATGGNSGLSEWASPAMRPHLLRISNEEFAKAKPPTYEQFWGGEVTPEGTKAYQDFVKQWSSKDYQAQLQRAIQEGAPAKAYPLLAGEAEARATQARIPLDAAQRRALYPEDSYDVPMNQLIVRQPTNKLSGLLK